MAYADNISQIEAALTAGQIDAATAADLKKQAAQQEFGAKSFDINEFQGLLDKLEGSKIRQKRNESVESRRNTMTQGLANMMSNF